MQPRYVNGITIFDLPGRLTIGTPVEALQTAIVGALRRGDRAILLNLGQVAYADSSGIGQLIFSQKAVAGTVGKLKLLNVTGRLEGVMRLTRCLALFETFDNEATAVSSFS